MVNLSNPTSIAENQRADIPLRSVLYTLAVIMLIAALAGLGLAYGLRGYFSAATSDPGVPALVERHSVTIGAQRYAIPASLIGDPAQRRDGFAERLDLTLALPISDNGLSEVDITLMPRGRVRTSAALLDSVYLHQFADTQLSGPIGLVGKPLEIDAGTQGETVWYDPLSAGPFVAKCMRPVNDRIGARTCMRVLPLSDRNTAIVTFEPSALGNWRSFDETVENALAMLRL